MSPVIYKCRICTVFGTNGAPYSNVEHLHIHSSFNLAPHLNIAKLKCLLPLMVLSTCIAYIRKYY